MAHSRVFIVSAGVLAGLTVLAGCGGSDDEAGAAPSATASSSKASVTPSASVSGDRGERLPAVDLAPFVSDRTFTGTYEGEPYVEYYAADGSLRGESGGESYTGSWAVEGDELCFTYVDSADGADEVDCYSVYRDGEDYLWMDANGDVSTATFEEGNSRGL